MAIEHGRVLAYPLEVSRIASLPDDPTAQDWADLASWVRGTEQDHAVLFGPPAEVPDGWRETFRIDCVQLVGERVTPVADPELVVLGEVDVPEMLDLVARTRPGPFEPATIRMGTYLGARHDGVAGPLVAMAGERMHPPGFTEISAVCADPAVRGRRLGTRLIHAVAHGIVERGETPFLHSVATNEPALRLYDRLGFVARRTIAVAGYAPPAS